MTDCKMCGGEAVEGSYACRSCQQDEWIAKLERRLDALWKKFEERVSNVE